MTKKKSARKPSVKVNDLANKKDPAGGAAIKFKFTTTTKDKVDTYLESPSSSLKTNALSTGWDVKTTKGT